jgi:pimeloyl-ACP methyl ester carboxylesterase
VTSLIWLWFGLGVVLGVPLLLGGTLFVLYFYLTHRYLDFVIRVFQEKPLFVIPRGQPVPGAEDVRFPARDGLTLSGCYLHTPASRRQGVILFGLEFGSNRWSCLPYCRSLLENGFDIFAFEARNQGESDAQAGYDPLQWVTDDEVRDVQAALAYVKTRCDADPRGVGLFGISKGGSAGLIAAAEDSYIRCFVTDGVFATRSTMVPYMRKWVAIVSDRFLIQKLLPTWYYGIIADTGLRRIEQQSGCRFPHLERALPRLAPRPILMIHGGSDTYIKPEMAQKLFGLARGPKELWIVDGAKHNQALQLAGDQYGQRVLAFFQAHLGVGSVPLPVPTPTQLPGYSSRAGLAKSPAVLHVAEAQPAAQQSS